MTIQIKKIWKKLKKTLIELGFNEDKIKYKTDSDTRDGKYYSP